MSRENELAAYLRRLVPMALKMHEKCIREGLIEDGAEETPIQRFRRIATARAAADTIIATQVKVDEASMRQRSDAFMGRLLDLVAQADRERGQ